MGQLTTCCIETKKDYDLIDTIYDIQETDVLSGIVANILKRDISWNSLRNVLKHSATFYVNYILVMPDEYLDKDDDSEKSNTFYELLKEIVMVQLNHYVAKENIEIITRDKIPQFDTSPSKLSKVVFIHIMPTQEQIDIDTTNNLDIYVCTADPRKIPLDCITLIQNKRFTVFYRK